MKTTINQRIIPMIWFDDQAEEAARFYTSVFPNSEMGRITHYVKEGFEIHGREAGSVMTIEFELDGFKFTVLNGGPIFKLNPSISFFYTGETEKQIETIWKQLSDNGKILMPLDKYPWSEKYGWVEDKYGVSWQIAVGSRENVNNQSIVPTLMYVKDYYGKAEKAMQFYTSIFDNSTVTGVLHYCPDELPDQEGTVKHAQFTLNGQTFMAMDSALQHLFTFNEAISLMVYCDTQEEIDYYWGKLTEGGDPKSQVCGWLKDQFGVAWQVVPSILDDMIQDTDTEKVNRVTKAYLGMKKFDIETLKRAFEGSSKMNPVTNH